MPKGRYHEWLNKDGLLKITGWARNGLTNNQIANNIGVSRDTLQKWIKAYPEISNALKEGRRPLDIEIENALIKKALGFSIDEITEEVKTTLDGKQEKHKKIIHKEIPPDTGAIAFYLKNRAANRYSDRPKQPEEIEKIILENERIKKDNEIKDLQIQALRKEIEQGTVELDKIDQILEGINNAAFKDAE